MSFRPAGTDIAVITNAEGWPDIVFDTTGPNKGNPRYDNTRAHALFSRIFRKKGRYYWDRTGQSGTLLHTVKDDRQAAAARIQSAVEDGADQIKARRLIVRYEVAVQRLRPGLYQWSIGWTPTGAQKSEQRTFRR